MPTYLAQYGHLPPEYPRTVYGIAQPVLENTLLNLVGNGFIKYRLLALFLIISCTYLIYKNITIFSKNRKIALIFAILWMSSNPTWAQALTKNVNSLQTSWPNLWIQYLTLLAISILGYYKGKSKYSIIIAGLIAGTLPFIRIQGVLSSLIIVVFMYLYTRNLKKFMFGAISAIVYWIVLISINGGLQLYFHNIFSTPVDGLNQYTTILYISNFTKGLIGYYLTLYWCYQSLMLIIGMFTKRNYLFRGQIKKKTAIKYYVLLSLYIIPKIFSNLSLWSSTLIDQSSNLALDLAVPLSFEIIALRIFHNKTINVFKDTVDKPLVLTAMAVMFNLIYQFPLPDLGHKWWASAFSAIFLYHYLTFAQIDIRSKFTKNWIILILVPSLTLSNFNIYGFQKINYSIVNETDLTEYNGLQIPSYESSLVKKFFLSKKLLKYLDDKSIEVNYYCRDGLYYINSEGYSSNARNGLNFVNLLEVKNYNRTHVKFYCNSENIDLKLFTSKRYIVYGDQSQDRFDFYNFDNEFYKEIIREFDY